MAEEQSWLCEKGGDLGVSSEAEEDNSETDLDRSSSTVFATHEVDKNSPTSTPSVFRHPNLNMQRLSELKCFSMEPKIGTSISKSDIVAMSEQPSEIKYFVFPGAIVLVKWDPKWAPETDGWSVGIVLTISDGHKKNPNGAGRVSKGWSIVEYEAGDKHIHLLNRDNHLDNLGNCEMAWCHQKGSIERLNYVQQPQTNLPLATTINKRKSGTEKNDIHQNESKQAEHAQQLEGSVLASSNSGGLFENTEMEDCALASSLGSCPRWFPSGAGVETGTMAQSTLLTDSSVEEGLVTCEFSSRPLVCRDECIDSTDNGDLFQEWNEMMQSPHMIGSSKHDAYSSLQDKPIVNQSKVGRARDNKEYEQRNKVLHRSVSTCANALFAQFQFLYASYLQAVEPESGSSQLQKEIKAEACAHNKTSRSSVVLDATENNSLKAPKLPCFALAPITSNACPDIYTEANHLSSSESIIASTKLLAAVPFVSADSSIRASWLMDAISRNQKTNVNVTKKIPIISNRKDGVNAPVSTICKLAGSVDGDSILMKQYVTQLDNPTAVLLEYPDPNNNHGGSASEQCRTSRSTVGNCAEARNNEIPGCQTRDKATSLLLPSPLEGPECSRLSTGQHCSEIHSSLKRNSLQRSPTQQEKNLHRMPSFCSQVTSECFTGVLIRESSDVPSLAEEVPLVDRSNSSLSDVCKEGADNELCFSNSLEEMYSESKSEPSASSHWQTSSAVTFVRDHVNNGSTSFYCNNIKSEMLGSACLNLKISSHSDGGPLNETVADDKFSGVSTPTEPPLRPFEASSSIQMIDSPTVVAAISLIQDSCQASQNDSEQADTVLLLPNCLISAPQELLETNIVSTGSFPSQRLRSSCVDHFDMSFPNLQPGMDSRKRSQGQTSAPTSFLDMRSGESIKRTKVASDEDMDPNDGIDQCPSICSSASTRRASEREHSTPSSCDSIIEGTRNASKADSGSRRKAWSPRITRSKSQRLAMSDSQARRSRRATRK